MGREDFPTRGALRGGGQRVSERRLEVLAAHLSPAPVHATSPGGVHAERSTADGVTHAVSGGASDSAANGGGVYELTTSFCSARMTEGGGAPLVAGGCMLDIQAHPQAGGVDITRGTSVPGQVRETPGGVARNIAESLARCSGNVGEAPLLLSMVGTDSAGDTLIASMKARGMRTDGIVREPRMPTPAVCAVFDGSAEVAACVADVAGLEEHCTQSVIDEWCTHLKGSPIIVVDANLSERAIASICRAAAEAGVPTWLEPVSVAKAARGARAGALPHVTYTSPNAAELVAMARSCEGGRSLPAPRAEGVPPAEALRLLLPHVAAVLSAGVRCIVLTLGADGVAVCRASPHERGAVDVAHLASLPPERMGSVAGCGDSLVAGTVASLASGLDIVASVASGVAAATLTLASRHNVSPDLDPEAIAKLAPAALATRKAYRLR